MAVKEITEERAGRQGPEYLVKWVGYAEPQWVPASDFDPEALDALLQRRARLRARASGDGPASRLRSAKA